MTTPSSRPTRASTSAGKAASKAQPAPTRGRRTARKASAPVKRPVGRPSAFQPAYVEQAHRLALLGATDAQMADFFGVAESTLNLWKLKHPEFSESLKAGKAEADAKVAESLYRAALGGFVTESKELTDADGKVITRTTETKAVLANVTAIIFWLKNRQPDKWRDRIEHEADVTLTGPAGEELFHLYEEKMARARARQAAILQERGLEHIGE